ncbi:insulinase family protein [Chitinophaga horti]|uniref:Insulinase family protein n=1 Tax=Chitinophaga horti TaxID=2920382 RepID=A0ABY6J019_9BACT|nr:M16 family metallopeptidase [Chitinophaga horti]UYQ92991.1 insulinase family protein [Chitinophaga horti]
MSGLAAKYAIANEYDKMMAGMGAQGTNAHTWVEETIYEEDIPSNAVGKFLAVQAERFRNPIFRIFHTELEAVYEEKNRGLDDDGRKMYELMLSTVFPTHNYGQQSTIGTVDHLKNPSLKAIRAFYNKYYVPNNMAVVMAGDFNPDYVIKQVDKSFGYMKPKPVTEYKAPPEKPITAPIVKEIYGPDAENVNLAFRLPGALDTRAAVVATAVSQVLSNGKAGLFDLNLNQQQKLLRSSVSQLNWKDYSVFMLAGNAKQGQTLDEVRDLLLSQIDILRKGDFDESLLKAIVNNFKLYEIQGLESNNNRANSLMDAFIKHRGNNWNYDVAFIDDMSKVTKKDIVDFANKYLANNYVILYKRQGEDKSIVKVDKPSITPVEVNRDAQSEFLRKIGEMPGTPVQPQWLDFDKDIQKGNIGAASFLSVQNKDNGLFRLNYLFDQGSWHNKKLPLAMQYLRFLATDKYSAQEISREFYNLACSYKIGNELGQEYTQIEISGLQENFDQAVTLFEHMLRNCKPDEAALVAMKNRTKKGRADAKLNKTYVMRGLVNYAMYGPQNPFNHNLSDAELDAITADELVAILHDLPNQKHSVVYYGPEAAGVASAHIAKLHSIPASFKAGLPAAKFQKTTQTANQVLFAEYDMVQAEVNWVRTGATYEPATVPVVELFNAYFGGGMGSIVFQTIRESKALAYSTYAVYSAPDKKDDKYAVVAYVGSQADKMSEAIGGMNELLNVLPESDKALATARESIRQGIETERVVQDAIIFSYLKSQRLGVDHDLRKDTYAAINKLGFKDVKQFHDANLANKAYTYCIVASEKNVKQDELKKIGEVKKLSLETLFGY